MAVAFLAGLLSFLSPCVLPLVPSYLSFITGVSGVAELESRRHLALLHAALFVTGFSLIFIALGATATELGLLLRSYQVWVERVGGLLIIAFGAGWTPCIGPILGSILLYTSSRADLSQGLALLIAYSLGLAIPFLVAAWALEGFLRWFQRFRRYIGWVEKVAGVLLIGVGLLMLSGSLTMLSGWLQALTPAFLRSRL